MRVGAHIAEYAQGNRNNHVPNRTRKLLLHAGEIEKWSGRITTKGYTLVPDESRYPYLHYKILVGLRNLSQERERALEEHCMRHPHIVYTVKALGPWDRLAASTVYSGRSPRTSTGGVATSCSFNLA